MSSNGDSDSEILVAKANDSDTSGFETQGQVPPCSWEQELSKEMESYNDTAAKEDGRAATEFYKRWKESEERYEKGLPETGDDEKSPFLGMQELFRNS